MRGVGLQFPCGGWAGLAVRLRWPGEEAGKHPFSVHFPKAFMKDWGHSL